MDPVEWPEWVFLLLWSAATVVAALTFIGVIGSWGFIPTFFMIAVTVGRVQRGGSHNDR